VGTGKTFLAECYAGSIGIPCVKLKNFRSKYVGETEGNLEAVLNVLRSLGPVVVLIDEADAALGNRQSEGDSGTSNRVFSMIASQMGDTRYRGKIIWMLLTCRPDLLPIDLKRQGRAEVHIPMFYPQDKRSAHVSAMARRTRRGWPRRSRRYPRTQADRGRHRASCFTPGVHGPGPLRNHGHLSRPCEFVLSRRVGESRNWLRAEHAAGFLPDDWRQQLVQPDGRSVRRSGWRQSNN
jgi:hypothetical protein